MTNDDSRRGRSPAPSPLAYSGAPASSSPAAAAATAAATAPAHVRRQPNAPVAGNSSLQITGIFGFGTDAPDYLMHDFEPATKPRARLLAAASGPRRGRSPNPLVWDESPEAREEAMRSLVVVPQSKRRAKSVPPPATSGVIGQSPAAGATDNVVPRKRGTYTKVPQSDPSLVDPLTLHPKSSSNGEIRYVASGRRLRRPASSARLGNDSRNGTGASLTWKEE
ncbi:hypothetical protein H9P43_008864 [Blastocladiella emersonii ATCC 22665]|nr:hypothetical protein H9P43_008864 [Blastocladiella emersonii ATCC 22665]